MLITSKTAAKQLLAQKLSELDKSYTLNYISQGDHLSTEQIKWLLEGDFEKLEDSVDDFDSRYDSVMYHIRGDRDSWGYRHGLCTDEEFAILDEADLVDELRFAIEERDDSDVLENLIKATSNVLVRFNLGVDIMDDAAVQAVHNVAEAVGIDLDVELRSTLDAALTNTPIPGAIDNGAAIAEMLAEQCEGGLYIYWSANLRQLAKAIQGIEWRNEKWEITWTDPCLLVWSGHSGAGYDCKVSTTFTANFELDSLHLDSGRGMRGYDDCCGGLTRSYYECKVVLNER